MSAVPVTAPAKISDYYSGWKYVKPFALGGTAGCFATAIIQPVDRIKVTIQSSAIDGNKIGFSGAASKIMKAEGVAGFYKGLSAGFLRQLTYTTSRLGLFRSLTNHFSENGTKKMDFLTSAFCSVVAGGIGAIIGNPADVALIRMQTQAAGAVPYKGVSDCMLRMLREEGVKSFFAGATPTVIRGLALNLGMLTSYDQIKQFLGGVFGSPTSNSATIGASIGSGIIGATMALPLDLIKTRMQRSGGSANGSGLGAMKIAAADIYAKGGLTGFYAGYIPFLFRIAPHIVLTWLTMEALNKAEFLK